MANGGCPICVMCNTLGHETYIYFGKYHFSFLMHVQRMKPTYDTKLNSPKLSTWLINWSYIFEIKSIHTSNSTLVLEIQLFIFGINMGWNFSIEMDYNVSKIFKKKNDKGVNSF